jgi:glyoxylase-like metal-dependent hydrolase (beta-lactamase superfamily II)
MRTHRFFALCLALAAIIGAPSEAGRRNSQAPGWFRYAAGDFTVTALQDGTINLGIGGYTGLAPEKVKELTARAFLLKGTNVQTSVNAYLVDTGAHRILVDAGNANCYGWKLGALPANLKSAGYAPKDIDIVVLTHLHGDHVCGLTTPDGKRVFPKAAVWAAEEEAAYWLSADIAGSLPEKARTTFTQAQVALAPYRAAGAFHTFKPNDTIAPGMRIVAAHGHTPGHTAFLFESKGASLLVWGDIVQGYAVQFPHPETFGMSDTDSTAAVATRQSLMEQLAKDGTAVAGAHLPFPGIGHLRKEAEGYAWVPVEFGPLP